MKGGIIRGNRNTAVPRSWNAMHAFFFILLIASLICSVATLVMVHKLSERIPSPVDMQQFLDTFTSHEETRRFVGQIPLNVVQVADSNLASMQSQIQGLDRSYLGNYVIRYQDAIAVYDFENDRLRGILDFTPQASLPDDFFERLGKHQESQELLDEKPIGGKLDAETLASLQQQFPEIYKDAKPGDYILRYQSRLLIFDYEANRIVQSVDLTQT